MVVLLVRRSTARRWQSYVLTVSVLHKNGIAKKVAKEIAKKTTRGISANGPSASRWIVTRTDLRVERAAQRLSACVATLACATLQSAI
jgi:hypothetical protein